MAVQVFYCSIEPLREQQLFEHYLTCVPHERRERVASLHREDDRLRSLGAGLMLEHALNRMAVPQSRRRVERLANGKPILADAPLQFSLSHSGDVALCAISEGVVGADVQLPKEPSRNLLQRVCSEVELAWLASRENSAQAFTALWTRKESLLKATNRTISEPLGQISVLEEGPLQFSERELLGLPACVCCPAGEDVIWSEVDLALEEIQNSFDSWSQF